MLSALAAGTRNAAVQPTAPKTAPPADAARNCLRESDPLPLVSASCAGSEQRRSRVIEHPPIADRGTSTTPNRWHIELTYRQTATPWSARPSSNLWWRRHATRQRSYRRAAPSRPRLRDCRFRRRRATTSDRFGLALCGGAQLAVNSPGFAQVVSRPSNARAGPGGNRRSPCGVDTRRVVPALGRAGAPVHIGCESERTSLARDRSPPLARGNGSERRVPPLSTDRAVLGASLVKGRSASAGGALPFPARNPQIGAGQWRGFGVLRWRQSLSA